MEEEAYKFYQGLVQKEKNLQSGKYVSLFVVLFTGGIGTIMIFMTLSPSVLRTSMFSTLFPLALFVLVMVGKQATDLWRDSNGNPERRLLIELAGKIYADSQDEKDRITEQIEGN